MPTRTSTVDGIPMRWEETGAGIPLVFIASNDGAQALVRQISFLRVEDTTAVAGGLPGLRVPARIVWGAADPFQKIAYGERFARDLSAPLRRIEGGRHFTPEDHPEILAQEIQELVRTVSESS